MKMIFYQKNQSNRRGLSTSIPILDKSSVLRFGNDNQVGGEGFMIYDLSTRLAHWAKKSVHALVALRFASFSLLPLFLIILDATARLMVPLSSEASNVNSTHTPRHVPKGKCSRHVES